LRTASHAVLRLNDPRRSLTKKAAVAGRIAGRSFSLILPSSCGHPVH
jgi:hypothetical protein